MTEQALDSIAIGGRFVLIGFAGGIAFPSIDPSQILVRGISITGALNTVRTTAERDDAIATPGSLFREGRIHMPIDQVAAFADIPDALDRLGGAVSGKLVARIADA